MTAHPAGGGAIVEGGDRVIRVAHLVTTLDVGGLERVVLNIIDGLPRQSFAHTVICLGRIGQLAGRFREAGAAVHSIHAPGQSRWARFRRLIALLTTVRPHILHTHNPGPHVHGMFCSRAAGVPVLIHTKHGRNYPDRPLYVALNRAASALSDTVVAVSTDAADIATRVERVPARKVKVIHNGVPVPATPSASSRRRSAAICVGRLDPIKDHACLLHAARVVASQDPSFRLDIVGDGPARAEIESLRDRLELRDRVRLAGLCDDVPARLAKSGLLVLCSTSEGLSLTVLEAMASGLPVVATDVGGNREAVVHGVTGLLVPPRSPAAAADAILVLLGNEAIAVAMGKAAYQRAMRLFNADACVSAYGRLYVEAMGRRTPSFGRTAYAGRAPVEAS